MSIAGRSLFPAFCFQGLNTSRVSDASVHSDPREHAKNGGTVGEELVRSSTLHSDCPALDVPSAVETVRIFYCSQSSTF